MSKLHQRLRLYKQGFTYDEIARLTGCSPKTVSSTISRARREGYDLPYRVRNIDGN